MRTRVQCLLTVWVVLASGIGAAAQERAQLAIVAFDATPGGWTVPPPHVGATIAELMLDRLIASGAYQIVDGQWLEPDGQGSRDQAAMARLLSNAEESGVDFVLLGSVTRFTSEKRHRGLGAGGFRLPLLGGGRRDRQELVVSLAVRIVEVRTGHVVASALGQGSSSRSNLALGGLGLFRRVGALGYSAGSSGSRDALLAEAIQRSVADAADGLVKAAPVLHKKEEGAITRALEIPARDVTEPKR
jgi:curli biogenesis system outer membrane secretion channel CsgG